MTHCFIGCEGYTWEYWEKNIEKIGEDNNYSKIEIKQVKALLKILKEQVSD